MTAARRVVALSGGIGGAKLALGLSKLVGAGDLVIAANTGDDFQHLGLSISPDIDTLFYTLAGLADPERGWGRANETWNFMSALGELGGETWFNLGDRDLALNILRTHRLAGGETLAAIARDLCRQAGVPATIIPVTNDRVRTRVGTEHGWLDFQDYFVRHRCAPAIRAIEYAGAAEARLVPELEVALAGHDLRAVIICPSNPVLSIGPMLAIPGLRKALAASPAPVIAVSPVIGGQAVKGPTTRNMADLGMTATARGAGAFYAGLIDGFVVDHADAAAVQDLGVDIEAANTLMVTLDDKIALAGTVLGVADRLASSGAVRRPGPTA